MTTLSNEFSTITGATGHIGQRAAEILLGQGKKVRVVARTASKLKSLEDKGAEVFIGDVGNAEQMTRAFTGAKVVFAMIPPEYGAADMRAHQNKVAEALEKAIIGSHTKHVVFLSSMGAHLKEKTGPILGLHDTEERLSKIPDVNILFLRPTYFMENLLMNIGLVKSMNIMGSPLRADVPLAMIATRDIAEVVASELASATFRGKTTRELLGPRDVTLKEVARVLGRSIYKPDVPYVQFPYDEAEKAMIKMGLSPDVAARMVEFQKSINDGFMKPHEPRSPSNTTPTTLEEFAESVFAPAFKAS